MLLERQVFDQCFAPLPIVPHRRLLLAIVRVVRTEAVPDVVVDDEVHLLVRGAVMIRQHAVNCAG